MMDILNQLLGGFATAGTPINLLWALPGIGPAVTVAMLLPITGQVEPTASMIFFAGIYYGAMYGGSTTSILLNTPGETGTMVTALEGFKMAKHGRAGAALATSAIGSFVAGLHHGERGVGPEHAAWHDVAVFWSGAGAGRHRPDHRPGSLHRRRAGVHGRHRGGAGRCGPVCGDRGALQRAV